MAHDLPGKIRVVQVRRRDQRRQLFSGIAIELARRMVTTASNATERWTAGMLLANALRVLGTRESGTARLEAAVAAYRAALYERTRDQAPLEWAAAQMGLATALWRLGEGRRDGTAAGSGNRLLCGAAGMVARTGAHRMGNGTAGPWQCYRDPGRT